MLQAGWNFERATDLELALALLERLAQLRLLAVQLADLLLLKRAGDSARDVGGPADVAVLLQLRERHVEVAAKPFLLRPRHHQHFFPASPPLRSAPPYSTSMITLVLNVNHPTGKLNVGPERRSLRCFSARVMV
eukprot:2677573-Rhodomonas_salina.1